MQSESSYSASPLDVTQAAREFAAEVAGSAERKKKTIPSPHGLQAFLLYVRANGTVPAHQVAGPITVQCVVGEASFTAEGQSHRLPAGTMISLAAGIPHDLAASTDSVLLVTHALQS